jgi:hypothetical protein
LMMIEDISERLRLEAELRRRKKWKPSANWPRCRSRL